MWYGYWTRHSWKLMGKSRRKKLSTKGENNAVWWGTEWHQNRRQREKGWFSCSRWNGQRLIQLKRNFPSQQQEAIFKDKASAQWDSLGTILNSLCNQFYLEIKSGLGMVSCVHFNFHLWDPVWCPFIMYVASVFVNLCVLILLT